MDHSAIDICNKAGSEIAVVNLEDKRYGVNFSDPQGAPQYGPIYITEMGNNHQKVIRLISVAFSLPKR